MRELEGERRNGEIGRRGAIGDRLDDARRYESERREMADVALDLVLASRDFFE
jgi:hypothetical protein